MFLQTFQADEWWDYPAKHSSELTEGLGLSKDDIIYICVPANNVAQAVIGSALTYFPKPVNTIFFESDDYVVADKTELFKVFQGMKDFDISKMLNPRSPWSTLIITKEIPEKRFSFDLLCRDFMHFLSDELLDSLSEKQSERLIDVMMAGPDGNRDEKNSQFKKYMRVYMQKAEHFFDIVKEIDDSEDSFAFSRKMGYDATIAPLIYGIARAILTPDVKEDLRYFYCPDSKYVEIKKEYAIWQHELDDKSRDKLDFDMKNIYERLYRSMFTGSLYKGTAPNVPCPCGSGRKYKKCCCRINQNYNIEKIMSDGIVIGDRNGE